MADLKIPEHRRLKTKSAAIYYLNEINYPSFNIYRRHHRDWWVCDEKEWKEANEQRKWMKKYPKRQRWALLISAMIMPSLAVAGRILSERKYPSNE